MHTVDVIVAEIDPQAGSGDRQGWVIGASDRLGGLAPTLLITAARA